MQKKVTCLADRSAEKSTKMWSVGWHAGKVSQFEVNILNLSKWKKNVENIM